MHAYSGAVAEGFLSRAKVSGSIAFRSLLNIHIGVDKPLGTGETIGWLSLARMPP